MPYQVQQYTEISKQLETAQALAPISEVKHESLEYITQEHDTSPFEDPAAHEDQEEYQELTYPHQLTPVLTLRPPCFCPCACCPLSGLLARMPHLLRLHRCSLLCCQARLSPVHTESLTCLMDDNTHTLYPHSSLWYIVLSLPSFMGGR